MQTMVFRIGGLDSLVFLCLPSSARAWIPWRHALNDGVPEEENMTTREWTFLVAAVFAGCAGDALRGDGTLAAPTKG